MSRPPERLVGSVSFPIAVHQGSASCCENKVRLSPGPSCTVLLCKHSSDNQDSQMLGSPCDPLLGYRHGHRLCLPRLPLSRLLPPLYVMCEHQNLPSRNKSLVVLSILFSWWGLPLHPNRAKYFQWAWLQQRQPTVAGAVTRLIHLIHPQHHKSLKLR